MIFVGLWFDLFTVNTVLFCFVFCLGGGGVVMSYECTYCLCHFYDRYLSFGFMCYFYCWATGLHAVLCRCIILCLCLKENAASFVEGFMDWLWATWWEKVVVMPYTKMLTGLICCLTVLSLDLLPVSAWGQKPADMRWGQGSDRTGR